MIDFGFYNMDCVDGMAKFPDKFFDLAIVDPPYGIGVMSMTYTRSGALREYGRNAATRRDYRKRSQWDIAPDENYFKELFRVSNRQVIWGGNYFSKYLEPSKSFIVWDKRCIDSMSNDFADCELAWCSNGMGVARVFRYVWNGMIQGDMKNKEERFHPTQKPVALYRWIIDHYAKPGDIILDTHVGSGSSLIACHETGHKYVGFEIDEEYYTKAKKRVESYAAQSNIFEFLDRDSD